MILQSATCRQRPIGLDDAMRRILDADTCGNHTTKTASPVIFRIDRDGVGGPKILPPEGGMAKGLRRLEWDDPPPQVVTEKLASLLGTSLEAEPPAASRADLLTTIREQIIPQLVMAHRVAPNELGVCAECRVPPTPEEILEFADLCVNESVPTALTFVQAIAGQGVSLEMILLHLISPAARLLGEQWAEDTRSFSEVTVGLSKLQQVVHILGPSFAPSMEHRGLVVLVAPQPEQHTLGIYLLGEFLRRAGWGVQVAPNIAQDELVSLVHSERVEMVGISVSNSELVKPVATLVAEVKSASVNPDLVVMVGGSPELADYADKVGAIFCHDAPDVVRWLDENITSGTVAP